MASSHFIPFDLHLKVIDMKYVLLFFLFTFFLLPCSSFAQNPADEILRTKIWNIGFGSTPFSKDAPRLTFDVSGPLVTNQGAALGEEGISSISTLDGELVAYGIRNGIFDNNDDTIPDSQNVFYYQSGLEAFILIPKPDSETEYMAFSLRNNNGNIELYWSELDYFGGITSLEMYNQFVTEMLTEGMAAVHHCNGKDIWITVHDQTGTNRFLTYLVDSTGLVTPPIINDIGPLILAQQVNIKYSSDGTMLAICSGLELTGGKPAVLALFRFDKETGVFSESIRLNTLDFVYGLSFSPDCKRLYVGITGGELFQYDVSLWDSTSIAESQILLAHNPLQPIHAMQNAIDGKLYLAQGAPHSDSLGIIYNPNAQGFACDYQHNAMYLGGTFSSTSLPNFPESYFNTDTSAYPCKINGVTEGLNASFSLKVHPNPSNGRTTIDLPNVGNVQIDDIVIFDALGRRVATSWSRFGNMADVELLFPVSGIYHGLVKTNNLDYSFNLIVNH